MRSVLLAVVLLLTPVVASQANGRRAPSSPGRIIGTLIDVEGRPLSDFYVTLDPFSASVDGPETSSGGTQPFANPDKTPIEPTRPLRKYRRWLDEDVSWLVEIQGATTDVNGNFEIDDLTLTECSLSAESSDYLKTPLTFTDGSRALVELIRENPVAHVVVVLRGPKAAVAAGAVTDRFTGQPLRAAYSLFRRNGNHEWQWLSQSASEDFRFLVPPREEIRLEASADGYKTASVVFQLEPGEKKSLNLQLVPDVKAGEP
jgi:hypothetical protein